MTPTPFLPPQVFINVPNPVGGWFAVILALAGVILIVFVVKWIRRVVEG